MRSARATRRRTVARSTTVLLSVVALAAALAACGPPATRGAGARETRPEYDPIEPVNRRVFWLNDKLDVYVLEPVATGWDRIAPDRVQRSIDNFFWNLRFPIVTVNDLLQGKVRAGGSDVARFVVNTTVGVLGFMDPATGWGFVRHNEDFGQTLGWWGVPRGPYLVLPVLGPSSVRDGVGLIGDSVASVTWFFVDGYILLGARTVDVVNYRSLVLDQVREAKRASFDYYGFVRNAYAQRRTALVNDRAETGGTAGTGESDEELYHPDLGGE